MLFLLLLSAPALGEEWLAARPDYPWSFPQDHWAREGYRTEWWYFTGHLESVGGPERPFGYQFTFFRIGLLLEPPDLNSDWAAHNLIMGHAAVTDLRSGHGRHVYSELLYREVSLLGGFNEYPDSVIAWSRGPVGTDGEWRLWWNGEAFDFEMRDDAQDMGFRLSTRPLKPLILQGPGGYSRKGDGPSSQYYSFTRLQTEGLISLDGVTTDVRGESWMDKEFGSSQLGENQVGWDWFSLQLEDGREVMLYLLRNRSGEVDFGRGTVVSPEGKTRFLTPDEWTVQVTETWKSKKTEAVYPSRWMLNVPVEGLSLEVIPELADQENVGKLAGGIFYWEGAVSVIGPGGRKAGHGYVEMTGYGHRPVPLSR